MDITVFTELEFFFRILIALFHSLCQLDLFLCGKKRHFTDLF